MGVVQLNSILVREHFPSEALDLLEAANNIVKCGADEEILLLETKLLALVSAVAGVKHIGNVLCSLLCFRGRVVVARVEGSEIKLSRRKALP